LESSLSKSHVGSLAKEENNIQATGFGFDLDQAWLPYAACSISSQPVKASRCRRIL